jgi:uncharacterized protein YprB with RNaseH-like and TPR domain
LWQEGILTWEDFLISPAIPSLSDSRKKKYDNHLAMAQSHLEKNDSSYFSRYLHPSEHWRAYEPWKDNACFLDIETTGFYHGITMVGIYSQKGYTHFVRGINLEKETLQAELEQYNMLITFYGKAFDMPFIERELGIKTEVPHYDLCFAGRKIGLRGGLKKVEQKLGICRDRDIQGLNGFDAVRLWRAYERGDEQSLETLIRYNRADTVNLRILADIIYEKLKQRTFLSCSHQNMDP